jgi:peptide/nickel transport system permease protein
MAIFILWVVATLNFIIFRIAYPISDPTQLLFDPDFEYEERLLVQELWGLNEPMFMQYLIYIRNMITWQYGYSWVGLGAHQPIRPEMARRLVNTVFLMGTALVGTITVGLQLGVLAGSRRGTKTDAATIGIGLFAYGMPAFLIQLLFLLFFSYYSFVWFGFPILPFGGVMSVPPPTNPILQVGDIIWHIIAPVTTLILIGFGYWGLYSRNLIVETLNEDFITTAQAKGLGRRDILYKHAFRSILPPIITMIALSIPALVTGSIITETIFSWPGIGQWYIGALAGGNHPVAQAVLFNFAVLVILTNLISDILYGYLDPRIKVGEREI